MYGLLKEPKGTITFGIGRSRKDFRIRSAQPKSRGILREAVTHYETMGDIGTHSLVKVMPETGRTHQIRVHMKAIHHPIVCDSLYKASNQTCDLGFNRLGLHAYSLRLTTPSGEELEIVAPVPPELLPALARFPGAKGLIAS